MAKLPEDGYVIYVGNEGYRVSDDFAECLICLLRYGDTSNVDPLSKIYRLTNENKRLKEDLKQVANEKRKLEAELEDVKNELMKMTAERNSLWNESFKSIQRANYWKNEYDTLSVNLEESQRNHVELSADVKALEVRFDIVSAASVAFRKDIQKLQEENIKLTNECNYLQHRNEGLSGSVEMFKKENKELKEQLEASSDLTMANELANIFAEYTVADQKNRDDLGDKITEFRRKYGLE